jgi:hypothetical protein
MEIIAVQHVLLEALLLCYTTCKLRGTGMMSSIDAV